MSRIAIPFLLVLVAVGLFLGFTRPLIDEVDAIQQQTSDLNKVLDNASELATVRDSLLKQYNEISEDDRARLNKAVPDQVDNVRLIIDVDTIAGRYGMQLRNAQVGTPDPTAKDSTAIGPDGKRYSTVTLSFEVISSYDNLKKFLNDLQQSLRVVDVNGLSFTANDKDVNTYSIELKTYWYRS